MLLARLRAGLHAVKEEQEHGQGAVEMYKMRLHIPLEVLHENIFGGMVGRGGKK